MTIIEDIDTKMQDVEGEVLVILVLGDGKVVKRILAGPDSDWTASDVLHWTREQARHVDEVEYPAQIHFRSVENAGEPGERVKLWRHHIDVGGADVLSDIPTTLAGQGDKTKNEGGGGFWDRLGSELIAHPELLIVAGAKASEIFINAAMSNQAFLSFFEKVVTQSVTKIVSVEEVEESEEPAQVSEETPVPSFQPVVVREEEEVIHV